MILQTIQVLSPGIRIGVVEGDTAPVTIDADKVIAVGCRLYKLTLGEIVI